MKTKILLSGLLLALATLAPAGTNDLTSALQKGLFEEEANHNLAAAIQAYQSVIAQFDRDRKLGATAVFRLGECYRKLGSTNEAAAQYERIVREFADQTALAELSRQRLPAQGALAAGQPASLTVAPPAASAEQRRLLDEEIQLVEQRLAIQQTRYQQGTGDKDAVFAAQRDLLELKRRKAALEAGQPASLAAAPPAATSAELEEVARIQEMVRNSPDLINASEHDGPTPLIKAAEQGQLMVVQYLLKSGADADLSARGATALCEAAGRGHLAIVELLLKHGAAVDAPNGSGETPLHRAAHAGFKSVVEALLAAKAGVNARDAHGETPLHWAAAEGFKSVSEVLLAAKADVNARNERGETPCHWAAATGQSALVELLLAHKAEVNAKNTGSISDSPGTLERTRDATPLVGAILARDVAVVKLLLAAKAEVNFGCEAGGFPRFGSGGRGWGSPLHFAVWVSSPEIAALLLDGGADPNAQISAPGETAAGLTPLRAAVLAHQKESVQLLLAHKADPNIPDGEGKTPLHRAVLERHKELVRLLLENHAEVNRQDNYRETALSYAVTLSETSIAAALLDAKADPNLKGQQGQTPLHHAVLGNKEMVELLLAKGANPNVLDKAGNTPLALAKSFSGRPPRAAAPQIQKEICELLRKHGAIEELPQMDVIEVRRPSANFSEVVFTKGTNNYNRFTLFELIAAHYGFVTDGTGRQTYEQSSWARRGSLAFPDLNSVTIRHPTEDGLGWTATQFKFSNVLELPGPLADRQLQWGDVVEIPEADHPINAIWQGLPEDILATLKRCVDRHVQLTVKGQTTNLLLRLQTGPPDVTEHGSDGTRLATPPSFSLLPMLHSSGLLRASSDLSRVRVKRRDATTGQVYELVFDCLNRSGPSPRFWLRNDDAIEVPEKP
jgi:ankyrin repeat protein